MDAISSIGAISVSSITIRGFLFMLLVFLCAGCLPWATPARQIELVEMVENTTVLRHPAWETIASGADIEHMIFDGEGYLWTAGRDGVHQWNLAKMTCVKHNPEYGLPGNYVRGLSVSGDGSLWVATSDGVANYRHDVWTTYSLAELPVTQIWSIVGGLGNTAWVTGKGTAYFDGIRWGNRTDAAWVESIAVSNDGVAWSTLHGLSRFDGEQWLTVLSSKSLRQIEIAPDDTVWGLLFEGGLLRYTDDTGPEIIDIEIYGKSAAIAVGPDLRLWLASGNHVSVWDGAAWTHSLVEGTVSAITIADDGALWYALRNKSGSVYRLDSNSVVEYTLKDFVPMFTAGGDLTVAGDGTVWVVDSFSGNLFHWHHDERDSYWKEVHFGSRQLMVNRVIAGSNGRVWFATSQGLWVTDDKQSFTRLSEDSCIAVQTWSTAPGGRMWIACGVPGTYTESLIHFDGIEWHNIQLDNSQEVTALAEVSFGELWIGTEEGYVKRWDGATWQRVEMPAALTNERKPILAMAAIDNQVWLATGGAGVIQYNVTDTTKWKRFTTLDGLPSDYVISLVFASDGGLWIGTDNGAAYLTENAWHIYTSADGLAHNRVNVLDVSPIGDVWFGTAYGISHFKPK